MQRSAAICSLAEESWFLSLWRKFKQHCPFSIKVKIIAENQDFLLSDIPLSTEKARSKKQNTWDSNDFQLPLRTGRNLPPRYSSLWILKDFILNLQLCYKTTFTQIGARYSGNGASCWTYWTERLEHENK